MYIATAGLNWLEAELCFFSSEELEEKDGFSSFGICISPGSLISNEMSSCIQKTRLSTTNLRHLYHRRDIRLSTKSVLTVKVFPLPASFLLMGSSSIHYSSFTLMLRAESQSEDMRVQDYVWWQTATVRFEWSSIVCHLHIVFFSDSAVIHRSLAEVDNVIIRKIVANWKIKVPGLAKGLTTSCPTRCNVWLFGTWHACARQYNASLTLKLCRFHQFHTTTW